MVEMDYIFLILLNKYSGDCRSVEFVELYFHTNIALQDLQNHVATFDL